MKTEKASPERLACLVDYYDKISNLLDAILHSIRNVSLTNSRVKTNLRCYYYSRS